MGMEEKKVECDSKKEFSRKEDGSINVVFKVDMHCEDCAQKVRRSVKKLKGVAAVTSEVSGNKLTVIGKVNPFELQGKLESKMHRKVELVFPDVAEKKDESAKAEGNEGRNDQKPEQSTEKEKINKKTAAATTSGQHAVKTAAAAAAAAVAAVAATLEAIKMEYYSHCYSNYPYCLEMAHAPTLFSEDPNECSIM